MSCTFKLPSLKEKYLLRRTEVYQLWIEFLSNNEDLEWAIGLNRFILKLTGLWPNVNESRYQKLFSNLCVSFTSVITMFMLIIPTLCALINIWGDMMSMIDNLQVTLSVIIAIFKVLIMWWKKNILSSVVSMIVEDWLGSKTSSEREIMVKQANRARIIIALGYCITTTIVIVMVVPPFIGFSMIYTSNVSDSERPLILQTYYPYDVSKSPNFELTLITQAFGVIMLGCSYTGIDNFLGLVVFHICGQIECLTRQLKLTGQYEDFYVMLPINIKKHVRLIRYVEIIENTFHLMILGVLFYFCLTFCLLGFLTVTVISQTNNLSFTRLSWLICYLINALLHVAIYCCVGEILISKSEEMYLATYNNQWYLLHQNKARSLILIMLRASRPLCITAGGIFPMTMTTFCNVLKTSASYISVLVATEG